MDRKIMFFDIDGTILTEDTRKIPESTVVAIKKARDNGHLAFINTGRTYFNIEKELHDIGFDGYVCGCGTYIRVDDKVILSTSIKENMCKSIINQLRKCKIDAVLEGLHDVYFDTDTVYSNELQRIIEEFQKKGYGLSENWDSKELVYDKLFIVTNEDSSLEEFKAFIKEEFDYIDRGKGCGEVIPKGYSKATGIMELLKYYDIKLENAYAFGDSSNDYDMLKYVPNSVAMGKSDECIYEIASFTTKDINDDGIEFALKRFRII